MRKNTIKILLWLAAGVAGGSLSAQGDTHTVRNDRVWVYSGLSEEKPVFYYGEFGSEFSVNGKSYHSFVITKSRTYSVDADHAFMSGEYVDKDMNLVLYSLREENGRIYELTADGELAHAIDQQVNGVAYDEVEIYDWNIADRDSWTSNPFSQPWKEEWGMEAYVPKIKLCDDREVAGARCKAFTLENVHDAFSQEMTFIEGIGPTCCGTIGDMDPRLISGHFATTPFNRLTLKCVLAKDGEVVFGSEPASVDMITDIQEFGNKSERTFDLFGREIKVLSSGSIYIRDGKKHIAR